ncbi:histidine kinase dimerization/phospho-acceptor domain-containing protein [Streptomyces olivaceus]|uniref:histidine kinase dimerization/phospho-acceptor domain-containing protein n=1 Tax=Streptomyces olivaceus TaxID=47716 RepID=UPI002DD8033E|nr:histidine kinase dimerization/phospho-acceptor domain-containing protein [Streptomyces olivaceus]
MRRFIADVSDELRALAGIKGLTELYRMDGIPATSDVDAAMGRMEREVGRLFDLVEELPLLSATSSPTPLRAPLSASAWAQREGGRFSS